MAFPENWPKYYAKLLTLGSGESSVGIATLWTKKDLFVNKLDKHSYAVIGQLYSRLGINFMLRNIFAYPKIRYLIVCGTELSGSGKELLKIWETGESEFLDKEKPQIVINAVGESGKLSIDWCETNKESTMLGNVIAAANISITCSQREIYFVHLSSGGVYNGNNNQKCFSEVDEPNFYNSQFYAKTKILSEKILKEFPGLILRINLPIDNRPHERNLIDKIKKYAKVLNVQNSMTIVPDMMEALKILIEKRKEGIYNLVNRGTISLAEIMQKYKEIVDPFHTFQIISLEELNKLTDAKRSNCILDTSKLESEGIYMPEIHKAVESCLLKYKENLK